MGFECPLRASWGQTWSGQPLGSSSGFFLFGSCSGRALTALLATVPACTCRDATGSGRLPWSGQPAALRRAGWPLGSSPSLPRLETQSLPPDHVGSVRPPHASLLLQPLHSSDQFRIRGPGLGWHHPWGAVPLKCDSKHAPHSTCRRAPAGGRGAVMRAGSGLSCQEEALALPGARCGSFWGIRGHPAEDRMKDLSGACGVGHRSLGRRCCAGQSPLWAQGMDAKSLRRASVRAT